ncbi:MAG: glycoside hydrolase family 3 C-terminal domain-containing protein [Salana multivorans]|uniref:glycoside hydrolase family 3 protein n=1 Tax=Salana multivorans TaxID=120377 RepID=UPI0009617CBE|nr:glycoside hydrolase family 3 N-terminal domain-containing protein [Salana multivorans]MBN8881717.1 glycoside hydrolase family 3 C-terminal domain-containing protein [Salana multivorans]OJX97003.1 MAG: glycoside hydrolase family 3 [Micrococcales bacterium 73-15]
MTIRRSRVARPVLTGTALLGAVAMVLSGCTSTPNDGSTPSTSGGTADAGDGTSYSTEEISDGRTTFVRVTNPGDGATLSYSPDSGIELLDVADGELTYAFKDLNGNGELDTWEDWRVPAAERAAALVPSLSTEQIAGLMLFSSGENSPIDGLSDNQRDYLTTSHLRNVQNAGNNDVTANVTWVNQMQAFVETLASEDTPYVPVNFASNPRSDATNQVAYSQAENVSQWPSSLGMAATFDPELVREFGEMSSQELRAIGITTLLGPQIDLASDPRWSRVYGTFGEDTDLVTDMTAAFVESYQDDPDSTGPDAGWGTGSVNAMIKHFPGDGAGESGRESHYQTGKYAVFPGDSFDQHLQPFLGSLDSAAIMTSYSITLDGEGQPMFSSERGTAYVKDIIDILREEHGYEGVLVTDWAITSGGSGDPDSPYGTAWGVDELTQGERHVEILKAGMDMFGGNTAVGPVMEAYDFWETAHEAGELDVDARTRFEESGARILTMVIRTGLYEDPFLDLESSKAVLGSPDKIEAAANAQADSVVMLKNTGDAVSCAAPVDYSDATVYIPRTFDAGMSTWFSPAVPTEGPVVDLELAEQYFGTVVTDEAELDAEGNVISYTAPDLSDVDLVLVGMHSPNNGIYHTAPGYDTEAGHYYPISLQYRPYTADGDNVRRVSISGDPLPDGTRENRSYFGQTSRISNEGDLDSFDRAVAAVEATGKDIPVIAVVKATNPFIPAEFESRADALLVGFGVSDQALLDVATGQHQPAGRLPMAFPIDMDAVEGSFEDTPMDVAAFVDSQGNTYDLGFGLSCSGEQLS